MLAILSALSALESLAAFLLVEHWLYFNDESCINRGKCITSEKNKTSEEYFKGEEMNV
jgi:hypothetical protein